MTELEEVTLLQTVLKDRMPEAELKIRTIFVGSGCWRLNVQQGSFLAVVLYQPEGHSLDSRALGNSPLRFLLLVGHCHPKGLLVDSGRGGIFLREVDEVIRSVNEAIAKVSAGEQPQY